MKYGSVPATLIGRLAIQKGLQRGGIGTVLLVRALQKAHSLGRESGSRIVVVDTISEDARTFYRKCGFQDLNNDRNQLFFDLRRVEEMAQKAGHAV
jgi:GNAT superfamily N-acetyltransferase